MRKKDEISSADSCMQRAHEMEMTFVLLGRDPAAPVAVRAWVAERIRIGKNRADDPHVVDALEVARIMEEEGRRWADREQEPASGSAPEEDRRG